MIVIFALFFLSLIFFFYFVIRNYILQLPDQYHRIKSLSATSFLLNAQRQLLSFFRILSPRFFFFFLREAICYCKVQWGWTGKVFMQHQMLQMLMWLQVDLRFAPRDDRSAPAVIFSLNSPFPQRKLPEITNQCQRSHCKPKK